VWVVFLCSYTPLRENKVRYIFGGAHSSAPSYLIPFDLKGGFHRCRLELKSLFGSYLVISWIRPLIIEFPLNESGYELVGRDIQIETKKNHRRPGGRNDRYFYLKRFPSPAKSIYLWKEDLHWLYPQSYLVAEAVLPGFESVLPLSIKGSDTQPRKGGYASPSHHRLVCPGPDRRMGTYRSNRTSALAISLSRISLFLALQVSSHERLVSNLVNSFLEVSRTVWSICLGQNLRMTLGRKTKMNPRRPGGRIIFYFLTYTAGSRLTPNYQAVFGLV
jgi:hypothetical protein